MFKRIEYTDINPFLSVVTDYSRSGLLPTQGFALSHEARAQSDLKFTYVVSCQIYGQQKQRKAPEAADIALLLQRYKFPLPFLSIESVVLGFFSNHFSNFSHSVFWI